MYTFVCPKLTHAHSMTNDCINNQLTLGSFGMGGGSPTETNGIRFPGTWTLRSDGWGDHPLNILLALGRPVGFPQTSMLNRRETAASSRSPRSW